MPIPWDEFKEQAGAVILQLFAPAFIVSLVVMLALRWLGGQRSAPLAAAIALAAAVLTANHFRDAMPLRFDDDRPFTWRDFRKTLGWSLEGKPVTLSLDSQDEGNAGQPEDDLRLPPS